MAINIQNDWQKIRQQALENSGYKTLKDGEYNAIITNSYLNKHKEKRVEIAVVEVEVVDGEFKGSTTSKTYFIDENYEHKKKRAYDWSQFVKLIDGLGLSFNNLQEFRNVFFELENKPVKLTIKRSEQTNENGKAYIERYIDPINADIIQKAPLKKSTTQNNEQRAIPTQRPELVSIETVNDPRRQIQQSNATIIEQMVKKSQQPQTQPQQENQDDSNFFINELNNLI